MFDFILESSEVVSKVQTARLTARSATMAWNDDDENPGMDALASYGFNECAKDPLLRLCNIVTCCRPVWHKGRPCTQPQPTCCCVPIGNGALAFPRSGDWGPKGALRRSFELLLHSQASDALDGAEDRSKGGLAAHLNATWCSNVNAELLHPAGYSCRAHCWTTRTTSNDNAGTVASVRADHLVLVIEQTRPSISDGPTGAPLQPGVVQVQPGLVQPCG